MKTDAKTMAEVLRRAADNIESGININDQIQVKYKGDDWSDRNDCTLYFDLDNLYRIKPKIIIVNGVEIPKPLSIEDLKNGNIYFFPALTINLFDSCYRDWLTENKVKFIYKTKEEAIEASKKLFGIE